MKQKKVVKKIKRITQNCLAIVLYGCGMDYGP